ncbi:hypothetical protein ACVMIH_007313 [Bradyrhizobium sp. USDA 4503]
MESSINPIRERGPLRMVLGRHRAQSNRTKPCVATAS